MPNIPIDIRMLDLPFIRIDDNGELSVKGLDSISQLKTGSIAPHHFNKSFKLVTGRGNLNLTKTAGRLPATSQLPTAAETHFNQRGSYLTHRAAFTSADWINNALSLYVPAGHAFYGEYTDGSPPLVQVLERSGSPGSYIYTPVQVAYGISYAFRAAKLIGSSDSVGGTTTPWQVIADGEFNFTVDELQQTLTGLDFTGIATMADVASVIDAAITGCTCIWETDHFEFESDAIVGMTYVSLLKKIAGGVGTDISGINRIAGNKGTGVEMEGIDGQWAITLEKDADVSSFDGLLEIG